MLDNYIWVHGTPVHKHAKKIILFCVRFWDTDATKLQHLFSQSINLIWKKVKTEHDTHTTTKYRHQNIK